MGILSAEEWETEIDEDVPIAADMDDEVLNASILVEIVESCAGEYECENEYDRYFTEKACVYDSISAKVEEKIEEIELIKTTLV